ncbi:MAG: TonB-dependent receptor [Acidobacteriota bacterium]
MLLTRHFFLLLLCSILVLPAVVLPADAQESTPSESEAQSPESDAASDEETEADRDEAIYDEIVVTGGLIADTVQDTPESVAIWNYDSITDSGATDLQDIFQQTANAYSIVNGEGFGIRGINHTGVGTGGIGELGSYYVDGVALTGLAKRVGPTQLWDVDQVEILRGPQTTNVGRNALAGAIVMSTRDPVFRNESQWRAGFGQDGVWEGAGMLNVPATDKSAFRLTFESWNSDGFVNNPVRGEDDYDARENLTLRAKYLYESQAENNFNLLLTAQYGETRRGNDGVELAFGGDRINQSNLESFVENDTIVLSADMRWDLNERWSLRSITSILDSDYLSTIDNDGGPGGGDSFSTRDSVDKNWAQDVRFEYSEGTTRGVVGLYYTEVDVTGRTFGEVEILTSDLGIPDFLAFLYPEIIGLELDTPFDIVTSNFAAFTHWDWEPKERWKLFAGLRLDLEDLDTFESVTTIPSAESLAQLPDPNLLPPPLSGAVAALNAALLAQAGSSVNDTETDYEALLPEFGVSYEFSDTLTGSLLYKQGYRAGGASINVVGRFSEYDPETLDLVEFSLRSLTLDNQLTINTNVYAGRWTDQQVSLQVTPSQFDFITINAGESEIYGFELDVAYRPLKAWDIYGSLGFASTEFTDFETVAQGDLTGNRFALAPEWTAALGANYRFGGGWFVHGDIGYQGEAFAQIENDPDFIADSRTLLNFRGGYETANYSILAYLNNATDELYRVTTFEGITGLFATYGDPRQAGVQVVFRF